MTRILVTVPVTLTVIAPVLTAGDAFSRWGLDTGFYRNWEGKYALPGSLIRGKLKEAMRELEVLDGLQKISVKECFGEPSEENIDKAQPHAPVRGWLKISDFVLANGENCLEKDGVRTRIRVDCERGTVEPGALLITEEPFKSGSETEWKGTVDFFCDPDEKQELMDRIGRAFLFIPTVGAEKTVGYGRLKTVLLGDAIEKSPEPLPSPDAQKDAPLYLELCIEPLEPLMIGGVRHTENLFRSETFIPGSVLKGAMAFGLNRICGNADLNSEIADTNAPVKNRYPVLAGCFEKLFFTRAEPSFVKFTRVETIPLSGVKYGKEFEDITFSETNGIYRKGKDFVRFQVDWKQNDWNKGIPQDYATPELVFHAVTRAAIDEKTRRAKEKQLYSFQMVSPKAPVQNGKNSKPEQVYWNAFIRFPKEMSKEDKKVLSGELNSVVSLALRHMGKRQSPVVARLQEKLSLPPSEKDKYSPFPEEKKTETFAIVLQTPAIMIDPKNLIRASSDFLTEREDLERMYRDFWNKRFDGAAEMFNYFAKQELRGGFQGMRFMSDSGHYEPFYLTCEGSTFVFRAGDIHKAWEKIDEMLRYGLELPDWAGEKYGAPAWKHCPYVPENGYGEIRVKTHKAAKNAADA